MATVVELEACEGFAVETPERLLGWVEGVQPGSLVVRTPEGSHGRLPSGFVQTVDADTQEVVVSRDAALIELDVPARPAKERPVWLTILLALGVIGLVGSVQMGACFLVAWLVTGHAY